MLIVVAVNEFVQKMQDYECRTYDQSSVWSCPFMNKPFTHICAAVPFVHRPLKVIIALSAPILLLHMFAPPIVIFCGLMCFGNAIWLVIMMFYHTWDLHRKARSRFLWPPQFVAVGGQLQLQ
jgi:hypothetical protein